MGIYTTNKRRTPDSPGDLRTSNKLLTAVWGSPGTLLGEMELVSQPEVLMGYTDSLHVAGAAQLVRRIEREVPWRRSGTPYGVPAGRFKYLVTLRLRQVGPP